LEAYWKQNSSHFYSLIIFFINPYVGEFQGASRYTNGDKVKQSYTEIDPDEKSIKGKWHADKLIEAGNNKIN
jgi:hypothetical protein